VDGFSNFFKIHNLKFQNYSEKNVVDNDVTYMGVKKSLRNGGDNGLPFFRDHLLLLKVFFFIRGGDNGLLIHSIDFFIPSLF
jgi:hypothetical protein